MSSQVPPAPWTRAQWEAITWRRGNLLVAAAAGAGKTSVLVERIRHLVTREEDPVDIDRLLVVTFTEAAAGEMRLRIGDALSRELAARPGDRNLARQLLLLQRARISTLHSFCLQVMRQYFYLLDIDPGFRVADPAETVLLQQEVLDEVMEQAYGKASAGGSFLHLVDAYGGGRGDAGVAETVLRLYTFSQSQPSPQAWLEDSCRLFSAAGELDDLPWAGVIRRAAVLELEQARDNLELACRLSLSPGGPGAYTDTLAAEVAAVGTVLADWDKLSWEAARTALQGIAFSRLPAVRSKDAVDGELKARVQELRREAREAVAGLVSGPLGRPAADLQRELAGLAGSMETLAALVRDFAEAYRQAKDERGLVDFADLEHCCLKILTAPGASPGRICPSRAALELREQFVEVLVDEYQDINAVQEAILNLVSRQPAGDGSIGSDPEPNLFMVGDIKQSIYRFRLAEPRLFLSKYTTYSPEPEASCRRLDLPDNFRSRQEVIAAVNFIFSRLFNPRVAELAYDEASRLRYAADYPLVAGEDGELAAGVEMHLIEAGLATGDEQGDREDGPPEGGGEPKGRQEETAASPASGENARGPEAVGRPGLDVAELETAEREARVVGQLIQELVGVDGNAGGPKLVWDREAKTYRPVTYRDIVVLLRATRDQANTYLEVWRGMDIPAYAELGTGYLGAVEVETMLSLLQVIDNPRQDIPLAAVLRSPLVGLMAADLAWIRLACPEGDFYDAVVAAGGEALATPGGEQPGTGRRPASGEAEAAGATVGEVSCPQAGVSPELAARLREFLARLSRWRTACRRGSVADLIWQVYRETNYYDYVAGLPGGAQRQANLRALYDRARQFEGFARRGLFRFLRFIQRLQESEGDLGTARALGENEDVVRLMSIHRSKGLEFPVVIAAGLGRRFNFRDLYGDVLCHRDLGLGPMVVDTRLRIKYPSLACVAVQEQLRREQLAEEMRVLYVALTRARERLVLVGSCRDLPGHLSRWQEAVVRRARSFLDWLGPVVVAGGASRGGSDGRYASRADGCPNGPAEPGGSSCPAWNLTLWNIPGGRHVPGPQPEVRAAGDLPWEKILRLEPIPEWPPDPALQAILTRSLGWTYPFQEVAALPAKTSVTELKYRVALSRLAEDEVPAARLFPGEDAAGLPDQGADAHNRAAGPVPPPPAPLTSPFPSPIFQAGRPKYTLALSPVLRRPRFLSAAGQLTWAEKGIATHTVLQHLDLARSLDVAAIRQRVQEMVAQEILTPEEAAAIDPTHIARFFAGPLGRRLTSRPAAVRREMSFSLALPARLVYPDAAGTAGLARDESETVLVQGSIDCLVDEDDGFLLIDFKTAPANPDLEATQLRLYALAVQTIFHRPVKEAYLYFLPAGKPQRVPLP